MTIFLIRVEKVEAVNSSFHPLAPAWVVLASRLVVVASLVASGRLFVEAVAAWVAWTSHLVAAAALEAWKYRQVVTVAWQV